MNHLTKSSDSDSGYLWATWHQNCSSGKTHSKEKGNTEAEQGKESSWTSAVSPGMPAVSSLLTQRASQNWTGTHQIKECLSFQVECLDPRTQRQDFLVQPAVVLHGLLQLRPVWTQHMDWSPALTVPQPFASTKLRAELSHEFLKLHCPYAQLCDSRVHTDARGSTVPSLRQRFMMLEIQVWYQHYQAVPPLLQEHSSLELKSPNHPPHELCSISSHSQNQQHGQTWCLSTKRTSE